MPSVGTDQPRLDGPAKVAGEARYADDIRLPGMWHGAVVRSAIPHGRVRRISLDPAFDWGRVVVADGRDIPGKNCVAMIEEDLPLVVSDVIRHAGEAILLVAAPERELAREACRRVEVEYEEWEPLLTIEESRAAKIKIRGEDNVVADCAVTKGDLEAGFAAAHRIVEGTYRTGHQEHMYLEPNGLVATPRPGGGFEVTGSLQCPYYVSRALSVMMGMPEGMFAVRQAAVGGAFGGKEDYPSILAGYAVVLARKCGRPVKIVYDRAEDNLATTKRHPSIVSHRTGVKRDGTLTAMEIRIEMDAGAYATLTPVVLSRGLLHSTGPYRCPAVRAHATAYATNTPPNGAFRGFGAPQVLFAVETHLDRVAAAVGIAPEEVRRRNCLRVGDATATGQVLKESVGARRCLEEVLLRSDFKRRRAALSKAKEGERLRRGIGMSLVWHGVGFTGSGEARIKGRGGLRLDPDGRIAILTSCTEMGQGSHTVLAQMAADHLGVAISSVRVETPDTSLVPDSGPTVASRTTMVMGVVLGKCAAALKRELFPFAAARFNADLSSLAFRGEALMAGPKRLAAVADLVRAYVEAKGPCEIIEHYELPPGIHWDEGTFRGEAYPVFGWGADVAEVEVDLDTFEVRVVKMWMAADVGRAINPRMAAGQIEGGTLQAMGWALMERHLWDRGLLQTKCFQSYLIPTAPDAPEMETILVEEPFSFGPMGAKGVGELPLDGGAPAIVNAIAHATGLFMDELPVTPERLWEAEKRTRDASGALVR